MSIMRYTVCVHAYVCECVHTSRTCVEYVTVAGVLDDSIYSDDMELLDFKQSSHWVISRMKSP